MITRTKTKPRQRLADDPARFHRIVGATTYPKQDEMIRAIFSSPRVAVVGCNSSGKDFEAARAALAWLTMHRRSKVIVIAPTHRQVQDVFWNEMRSAYRSKAVREDWGFRIYRTARIESEAEPQERFGIGFATQDPASGVSEMPTGRGLQGFHSPNLLAIISEAHAVHQSHIDEIRRLNPRCLLMTGNPFVSQGEFYDAFHSTTELWHTIQISAFDTPNLQDDAPDDGWSEFAGMVTRRDVEARKLEWGESNPLYVAGVLGQFPDNLEGMVVVPLYAARAGAERQRPATGPVVLAVDIAAEGDNKTVWMRRQGLMAEMVERYQGVPVHETEGRLLRYLSQNHVDTLVVDVVGVGTGVPGHLREHFGRLGITTRIVEFRGGNPSRRPDDFADMNAECWWAVREWLMNDDGCIPNDPALIAQLTGRSYTIQSDRRIKLEPKEKLRKSPDEADALAMTWAAGAGRSMGLWV